jgi:general stress protein YciG
MKSMLQRFNPSYIRFSVSCEQVDISHTHNAHHNRMANNRNDNRGGSSQNSGSKRGFAAMDPEKQREIAAKGGRASHGGR